MGKKAGKARKKTKTARPTGRASAVRAKRRPNHADDDGLMDRVLEDGEEVAYQDWDSGGPGAGAGHDAVYRYGRKFYALDDEGLSGPYASLDAACKKAGIDEVNSATVEIWRADKGFVFEQ